MLIIIEGLDSTGKTTLATELARQAGHGGPTEVRHFEKPQRHPLTEYTTAGYDPCSHATLVCDRYHWGERVWPVIYGRESEYDEVMFRYTELYLLSLGAVMIHATARAEEIIERLAAADDPYPPADQVQPALDLFYDVDRGSVLPTYEYDFTRVHVSTFARQVLQAARYYERRAAAVAELTTHWVGHPRPRMLLVGDQPGPQRPAETDLPFRPYRDTCGYWLGQTMGSESYALTNAIAEVPLRALWAALSKPRVVALGNVAHDGLMAAGVPHGVVPHPQWVRRFHHRRLGEEYRRVIWLASFQRDMRKETRLWT